MSLVPMIAASQENKRASFSGVLWIAIALIAMLPFDWGGFWANALDGSTGEATLCFAWGPPHAWGNWSLVPPGATLCLGDQARPPSGLCQGPTSRRVVGGHVKMHGYL